MAKASDIVNNASDSSPKRPLGEQCPEILVYFRPHKGYDGEYGFDWIRTGDTKEIGDKNYKPIVGSYKRYSFVQSDAKFNVLQSKYLPRPCKFNPKIIYTTAILCVYPKEKTTLSLFTIAKKAGEVKFSYDEAALKISKKSLNIKKGKNLLTDEIEIECIKPLTEDAIVEVKADGVFAGRLKVMANDLEHQHEIKIVLVEVKTLINRPRREGESIVGQEKLKKFLNQALIKATFENFKLDLTKDKEFNNNHVKSGRVQTDNNIFNYLDSKIKKTHPHLSNTLKVYFFDEPAGDERSPLYGEAEDIPAKSALVFRSGLLDTTAAHESFHAMGLHHSFSNSGAHTFEMNKTDNIMDYSDMEGIPVISTWHWQWPILWENSRKI